MKKFIKNKKGFTLVELVVSVAILGLITITIMGLMTTGTNIFTSVQKRTMIMFKAQSVSTQVKSYLHSCSGMIGDDQDRTNKYIIFTDKDNIYEIYHNASEEELSLVQLSRDQISSVASGDLTPEEVIDQGVIAPLSYNVKNVSYKINTDSDGYATSIKIDLTVTRLGQEYTRSQVIALRSKILYVDLNNDEAYDDALMDWYNR